MFPAREPACTAAESSSLRSPAASERRSTCIPPTRSWNACSMFQQALAGRDHLVCYAVKANSALAILKLLADHGAGFDIVSGGELERVIAAAPEAVGRVVFSGVGKTAAEIDRALIAGILEFNVESEAELELLAARAKEAQNQDPVCTSRQSRCLRRDASIHLDWSARAQVRYRHPAGLLAIYRSAAEPSLAGAAWGKRSHRLADPVRRSVWRCAGAGEQAGSPAWPRGHRSSSLSMRAGGWASITTAAAFDPAARVQEYAAAIDRALEGFQGPAAARARPFSRRPGRGPGGACAAGEAQWKQDVCHHRCGHERPHPPGALPGLPRHRARDSARGPPPYRGCRWAGVRVGRLLRPRSQLGPVAPGDLVALLDAGAYGMAQSSNYNTRLRPAEVLVEGPRRGSSAGARRWLTCWPRRYSNPAGARPHSLLARPLKALGCQSSERR